MSDPIAKVRATVTAEIVKAVREEIRWEMIMAGVVDSTWHVPPEDRVALAARLRRMADELDTRPNNSSESEPSSDVRRH